METLYNIPHKGKAIALLLLFAVVELFNCTAYSSSITEMRESFSEVYADRLVAQHYLYQLADKIHERKLAIAEEPDEAHISKVFSNNWSGIISVVKEYEKTKFTKEEAAIFQQFKANLDVMFLAEQGFLKKKEPALREEILRTHDRSLTLSLAQLSKLSDIQVARGKDLKTNSEKISSFSYVLNQLDFAMVVIVALLILGFAFAAKSVIPKQERQASLN